jgi:DNA polymerase-3 subunit beta
MQARVEKTKLEALLRRADEVADKKASMAVLSMALLNFEPEEKTLYITTTDLEHGFRGKVPLDIEGEPLSFCVPCRKFLEIVKDFPEDIILLIKEDSRLVIRDEDEKEVYELAVMESDEFPSLPEFFEENLLEIPAQVLSELIRSTIFAASKDEARFVLGGVYLEPLPDKGLFRAVASDGHRLALLDREVPNFADSPFKEGIIVSKKGADIIADLSDEELLVKLGFVNNYVVLYFSDGFFFTRTIEGSFPDYRAVIPQEFQNRLKLDRKLFLDALKRASLVISEKFKPIRLELTPIEVVLSSPETETSRARIRIPAEYEGEALNVSFNAVYLISALENMKSEEVELKLNDERRPAVITGYRDEGFLYLLMPMVI